MKKLLLAALVSSAFSGGVFAACADADLTPDVYNAIQRNDSLGSIQARLPCGLPTPTTYTDGIGRQFQVYTWSTLNKSMTIQTFESRVFTKTGSGLGFQATKETPPAAAFDSATNVMTLPVITVTDAQGNRATYYDAKVALNENGSYAILSMDTTQRGDVAYDTRGYAPANLDSKTGSLTVPSLVTADGTTVAFQATLGADGKWTSSTDAQAQSGVTLTTPPTPPTVAPAEASFDDATRVMTLPVLVLTDTKGVATTYYDAQIALTANGGWSLLSKATTHAGIAYDTTNYTPASLDLSTGTLMVSQLKDSTGKTSVFRATLAADGTWADQSDVKGAVSVATPVTTAPALAGYNSKSDILSLPVLSVTDANGQTQTYYDAQISLTPTGEWTIVSMGTTKRTGTPYDTSNYQIAKLELTTGALVVPALSNNNGSTQAFRAILANNGTWKDASDAGLSTIIPSPTSKALVSQQQFDPSNTKVWPGLAQGGVIVVGGTAYRNTDAACAIPSAYDSISSVTLPGSLTPTSVQSIANNPNVYIYQQSSNLYVTVDGWNGGCQVTSMGQVPN